jgi:hypothetical protein
VVSDFIFYFELAEAAHVVGVGHDCKLILRYLLMAFDEERFDGGILLYVGDLPQSRLQVRVGNGAGLGSLKRA